MRLVSLSVFAVLAACNQHGSGGFPDGGFPRTDGGGTVCGGFANTQCAITEFCDFGDNNCGNADGPGICTPRPQGCPDNLDPVCACDGQVHANECDAESAGFDVNATASCTVTTGDMACGFRQCQTSTSYCEHIVSSIQGVPDTFTCKPLPTCVGTPTCVCLQNEQCGAMCSGTAQAGLTLVCHAGHGGGG